MKTLIVFMSTHGCTEKTVVVMREILEGEITVVNLKKDDIPFLTDFDRIIIGGSIHAGQIQKRVREFCSQNLDILIKREVGLFICCMEEGEKAQQQLQNAFPKELIQHAKTTAVMGGEFNFKNMNFLEKAIIKKVAKVNESVSKIDPAAIDKFVRNMDKVFNPVLFLG
jgi:menaquinone-dependent protoporphyrinogen oxidase